MREFFHGWRRKVGAVTLLIACVLLVIWMRSLLVTDFYAFPRMGPSYVLIESSCGSFQWNRISSPFTSLTGWGTSRGYIAGGFTHGVLPAFGDLQVVGWTIPYWSIVLPLTLLSAYLLLWKPRTRTKHDA